MVTKWGRLCLYRKKINLSKPLAGKAVGVKAIWRKKLCSPATTPSDRKCHLCLRNDLLPMCPGRTPLKHGAGDGARTRDVQLGNMSVDCK